MKGLLCARSLVRSIWLALARSLVANEESDVEDGWCLNMCTKSDALASLPSPPAPASPRSPSLRQPGPGASGPGPPASNYAFKCANIKFADNRVVPKNGLCYNDNPDLAFMLHKKRLDLLKPPKLHWLSLLIMLFVILR